jgi:hypothetical protein
MRESPLRTHLGDPRGHFAFVLRGVSREDERELIQGASSTVDPP